MKIYLELPTQSRGLQRVYDALVKFNTKHEVVKEKNKADLVILHVYGRLEHTRREVDKIRRNGQKYAIIQYCIRSTINPKTIEWLDIWNGAELVWSYYDLKQLCIDDGLNWTNEKIDFPFYLSPLGVEPIFFDRNFERKYIVIATSQHALSEGVRECTFATKNVGKKMFFVGHELRRGKDIVCKSNLTDNEMANMYSSSMFVSGLRRVEGFEFPVIEGLMCGARPIVYNNPSYRKWFSEFSIFIKEDTREKVIEYLTDIFNTYNPVRRYEKELAIERFNWERIINNFYKLL